MILQDLIRNIVLYKGIIRPFLQSWKESLLLVTYRVSPSVAPVNTQTRKKRVMQPRVRRVNASSHLDKFIYRLTKEITSLNTITAHKIVLSEDFSFSSLNISTEIVTLNSRSFTLLLEGNDLKEQAIMTSKTVVSATDSAVIFVSEKASNSTCSTTGFDTEKISSFLFHETHERREYLGEFSLPHEEIHLMYRKERR